MKKVLSTYNRLSAQLASRLSRDYKDRNAVFSPFSALLLIAIIRDATGGKTREEIEHAIIREPSSNELEEFLSQRLDIYKKNESILSASCVCAHSLLKESIAEGFEDHLQKAYDGKLFFTQDIGQALDSWVKAKTKGMIEELPIEPVEEHIFTLGNAVSFADSWKTEYDESKIVHGDFTNSDNSVSNVRMLISSESTYVENNVWEGFIKPYKNSDCSFMALLPKQRSLIIAPEEIQNLDLTGLYASRKSASVNVLMPEFSVETDFDISSFMKDMGIQRLFSDEADFTPFSDEWLKAELIVQKTRIEVDRKGTKACSTGFLYGAGGCAFEYENIYLTRPFLYVVIDNGTGMPLFMGIVNHLDTNTDHDGMTFMDKAKLCRERLDRLVEKLQPYIDEDGVLIEGSAAENLYRRARKICMHADLQKMDEIEKEAERLMEEYNVHKTILINGDH